MLLALFPYEGCTLIKVSHHWSSFFNEWLLQRQLLRAWNWWASSVCVRNTTERRASLSITNNQPAILVCGCTHYSFFIIFKLISIETLPAIDARTFFFKTHATSASINFQLMQRKKSLLGKIFILRMEDTNSKAPKWLFNFNLLIVLISPLNFFFN